MSSVTIVVLVNGEATPFFSNERGLRQGCPLSPLLFILALEGLSILLKSSQLAGKITGIKVSRLVKILHIFFVDDILIATRADPQEWLEINTILNYFCRASGLQINETKSTFHHSGLSEVDIESYRNIFPFCFLEISQGLRYLGYFLKPDCYKVTDWHWILKKFEKRISTGAIDGSHWGGDSYLLNQSWKVKLSIGWLWLPSQDLY
jgi:hypothetical protein